MNIAIIVAAGSGLRFGSQPKQFVNLLGKSLIVHTIERFESCPVIDQIVLVLSEEGQREFEAINLKFEISKLKSIVAGGKTRAQSVKNALDAIEQNEDDIIAVHDGARPLVSVDEIVSVVEKAEETGAACLVSDVTDTIKEIENGQIVRTIDRRRLRRALTPQAFRYDILCKGFEDVQLDESITDECYLVEKLGVNIAYVVGSVRNIKITRPEDLILAEAFLKSS
jgi:2-C-methyl-D-erythritol 4-phosphate cytidylyltransferase